MSNKTWTKKLLLAIMFDTYRIRVSAGKSVTNVLQARLMDTYHQRGTMHDHAFTVIAVYDGCRLRHHARN